MVRKNLTLSIVKKFIPARNAKSRKGDNGITLVVGGSYIYHGAPILSSLAALKCAVNKLIGALPRNLHSATIGMGLAIQERNSLLHFVKSLLDRDVRLSLDASALIPEVLPLLANKNVVVTPHAGEFKRLFGESPSNSKNERIKLVENKSKEFGITVLLKGATDVISNGSTTYFNEKKTPAMTVGGTGDVLSGLVAGLLSNNRNPLESAAAATFINGLAGKAAQKKLGLHMTSMDLLDEIPYVMKPFDRIV
jgi:NAD(P)H-hydrate epimerase